MDARFVLGPYQKDERRVQSTSGYMGERFVLGQASEVGSGVHFTGRRVDRKFVLGPYQNDESNVRKGGHVDAGPWKFRKADTPGDTRIYGSDNGEL